MNKLVNGCKCEVVHTLSAIYSTVQPKYISLGDQKLFHSWNDKEFTDSFTVSKYSKSVAFGQKKPLDKKRLIYIKGA